MATPTSCCDLRASITPELLDALQAAAANNEAAAPIELLLRIARSCDAPADSPSNRSTQPTRKLQLIRKGLALELLTWRALKTGQLEAVPNDFKALALHGIPPAAYFSDKKCLKAYMREDARQGFNNIRIILPPAAATDGFNSEIPWHRNVANAFDFAPDGNLYAKACPKDDRSAAITVARSRITANITLFWPPDTNLVAIQAKLSRGEDTPKRLREEVIRSSEKWGALRVLDRRNNRLSPSDKFWSTYDPTTGCCNDNVGFWQPYTVHACGPNCHFSNACLYGKTVQLLSARHLASAMSLSDTSHYQHAAWSDEGLPSLDPAEIAGRIASADQERENSGSREPGSTLRSASVVVKFEPVHVLSDAYLVDAYYRAHAEYVAASAVYFQHVHDALHGETADQRARAEVAVATWQRLRRGRGGPFTYSTVVGGITTLLSFGRLSAGGPPIPPIEEGQELHIY